MAIRTEKTKPVRDEMNKIYTGKTRNAAYNVKHKYGYWSPRQQTVDDDLLLILQIVSIIHRIFSEIALIF